MANIQYQRNPSGYGEFDAILYDNNGVYTGVINSTGTVYTNSHADVVLQDLINNLSSGSSVNANGYSTGGTYGEIRVGPGTYNIYSSVILQPNISIRGSGAWATIFQWPNNTIPTTTSGIMFKGANWDTQSTSTTPSHAACDSGIRLRDFQMFGNWENNVIAATGTQTTTVISNVETAGTNGVAGSESWGHGVTLYGTDAWLEGLLIHGFPGAGVILQYQPVTGQIIEEQSEYWVGQTSGPASAGFISTNNIIGCNVWGNGRQGMCIRSQTNIDRCWTYENGEAGIDFQQCGASGAGYFGGGGTISNSLGFSDGANYGGSTPQTSTTYAPLGFEWRVTSPLGEGNPIWLINNWIEAPYGPGDNLSLGASNAPSSPTGWQIGVGQAIVHVRNCHLDNVRFSGIYMPFDAGQFGPCSIEADIDGTQVSGIGYSNTQTAVTLDGASYNHLDIQCSNFNGTVGGTPIALVLGNSTNPSWGNRIKLTAHSPVNVIDWVNSGNTYNTIEAYVDVSGSPTTLKAFSGSTSSNVNYSRNDVNISGPFAIGGVNGVNSGNGTASILTHNGGTAIFSGTGSQTAFDIAHNLVAQPLVFTISPGSTAASGAYALTATATNLVVTYGTAPGSGTNNVVINWNARVSP